MITAIGEILFDVFPDYKRLGGAPFNFAYHAKQLDFDTVFVSRVGEDAPGREIIDACRQNGFDLQYIQIDSGHKTGEVQVKLDPQGVPDFDIVENAAYDHIAADQKLAHQFSASDLIYVGTLAQRTPSNFGAIQYLLAARDPGAVVFYDMNLRKNCYSREVIEKTLEVCNVLKLNQEELEIANDYWNLGNQDDDMVKALIHDFDIRIVALTKGEAGSEIHTAHDIQRSAKPEDLTVVDTVGAGDGYAAILAAGILHGWSGAAILKTAADFASALCGVKGAIPSDDQFYSPYRKLFKG